MGSKWDRGGLIVSIKENIMDLEELKAMACRACIDLYLSIHVSQLNKQTEQVKKAWHAGKDLYLEIKR